MQYTISDTGRGEALGTSPEPFPTMHVLNCVFACLLNFVQPASLVTFVWLPDSRPLNVAVVPKQHCWGGLFRLKSALPNHISTSHIVDLWTFCTTRVLKGFGRKLCYWYRASCVYNDSSILSDTRRFAGSHRVAGSFQRLAGCKSSYFPRYLGSTLCCNTCPQHAALPDVT